MMTSPSWRPAAIFVRYARKVYRSVGFRKGYNFALFFICAGALAGFCLARLKYLNFSGIFCPINGRGRAAPGECYFYRRRFEKFGILLHLAAILPAGLLAVLQFVPVLRHRFLAFHRANGHIVLLLSLAGTAGALMVATHAFGGGLEMQTGVGLLATMFITSLALSYYNVKHLRIEQHRSWMLRAWFYVSGPFTSTFNINR